MTKILGIDLGTINSCVAVVIDGKAVVLRDGERSTIPSCVAYQQGKVVVGHAARRAAVTDPHNTISAVKRLIGHSYQSREVQLARERAAYAVRPGTGSTVVLDVSGYELTPIQVSARILERVRAVAEHGLGEPVKSCVISVPAHFNDVQRKATKLAAEYAGLEVRRLINEPTAAAFAYGYKRGDDFTLAVYDLGGGTFDITVMRAEGDRFSVLATDGDSYLGGEDFDYAITDWIRSEFEQEHGFDLRRDPPAWLRAKEAAERAKIELTDRETSDIELPFLTQLPDGSRPHFRRSLRRSQFQALADPIVRRTLELCERCLRDAGVSQIQIDDVLLVGGQSRMPAVRNAVREFFAREPRRDINPDEVVAIGAALYAYSISADELTVEAEDEAGDAYEIAVRNAEVARRMVDEVEKLGAQSKQLDDSALRSRLEALLARTELPVRPTTQNLEPFDAELTPSLSRLAFGSATPATGPVFGERDEDLPSSRSSDADVPIERAGQRSGSRRAEHAPESTPRVSDERGFPEDDEDTLPSLSASLPAQRPRDFDLPAQGPDKTPVQRRSGAVKRRPAPVAASMLDELDVDESPTDPSRDPSLPRRRPDAEQLPIALQDLNSQLEELNHRAQEVIERLAAGLSADDLDAETGGAKPSPLQAAADLIAQQLGSAEQASHSARARLEVADEHRNARRVDLVDVTSHAVGIGAALDLFTELIPHNTAVPVARTRIYTTNQDGQSEVEIRVYQGRHRLASENQLLGSFILQGIPPAPRMTPKIEVTFSIDADGILSVRARDAQTLREQSIRVEDPLGLQQVERKE